MEILIRTITNSTFLFPFASQEYAFAQPLYDRLFSLSTALGGRVISDPPRPNITSFLFKAPSENELKKLRESTNFECFNSGGVYDEAWGIAKRILDLVRNEKATFDQIAVVVRSMDKHLVPLTHVFAENRIPCDVNRENTLSQSPFARFAYSTVLARLARCNHATLDLEMLSSPFLKQPSFGDFRNLEAILTSLFIRNWDDWQRLQPLVGTPVPTAPRKPKQPSLFDEEPPATEPVVEMFDLPAIFDFIKPSDIDSFRKTVFYLLDFKKRLLALPESESLPGFARKLKTTLQSICEKQKEEISHPLYDLLDQIADFSMFEDQQMGLAEFADLLKFYLQRTTYEAEDKDEGCVRVTIGDIMQLRGTSADYVFVAGLNQEVFPRRAVEDPFLPDATRSVLRSVSGAGPAPKRTRLLPLKEGSEEELLLFGIALRSARKKLTLSYSRADEQGRKTAPSSYLDETIRLLTGSTCENNPKVKIDPKQNRSKFIQDRVLRAQIIPNISECAILSDFFSAQDLVREFYKLPASYIDHVQDFSRRLNSLDIQGAADLDGCMSNPAQFWSGVPKEGTQFRFSYSRFKNYLECPYKFFATTILRLQESPKDAEEESHDISQLMKGIISEDVVKTSFRMLRDQTIKKAAAIQHAVERVRSKYVPIFPAPLLDHYLKLFQKGTVEFIDYIEELGFDLKRTEAPDYGEGGETELVRSLNGNFSLMIKGIPDFVFHKNAKEGLVVDLKWGTRSVMSTINGIWQRNEAQFCIYPAIIQGESGIAMPFQYFRLDAFCSYGSPSKIEKKILSIDPSLRDTNVAIRVFGEKATPEQCQDYFQGKANEKGIGILEGDFRIIKDPNAPFTVCKFCSFTQICRRTHTGTLLRSRQAELT